MSLRHVAKVLGIFLLFYSAAMLVPLGVGAIRGDLAVEGAFHPVRGFLLAASAGFLCGGILWVLGRRSEGEFYRKDGILAVSGIWIAAGMLGALPFVFSGVLGFWDGFFEATSGLTTTGSSVFGSSRTPRISELPSSILFWRALTHWMGGLGIVVMFLVFLPALGITEKTLFQAEVPGVSKEGLRPRIRQSALVLFRIYLLITSALILGYLAFGMGVFDAVCHSFATIATGGFSTRDYSVGEFNSLGIEVVAITGMILAGTNFALFHRVGRSFRRSAAGGSLWNPRNWPSLRELVGIFSRDPEFRFYFLTYLGVVVLITFLLLDLGTLVPGEAQIGRNHDYSTLGGALRDASFQTASLISSTGFANSNLLNWPLVAQAVLVLLMIGGACGGSTGGGIKAARVLILAKHLARGLRKFVRPRAVDPVRFGENKLDRDLLDSVLALFVSWILILALGSILVLFLERELDVFSAFTTTVTCLNNMGPGFTALVRDAAGNLVPANPGGFDVGSYGCFGEFGSATKGLLGFVMILGRLEVYAPLAILMPGFWRD